MAECRDDKPGALSGPTTPVPPAVPAGGGEPRWGVVYSASAYLIWGLFPLYFKAIAGVPAIEVLAHRVVWSCLLFAIVLALGRRWQQIGGVLRSRRWLPMLVCSALLIGVNWGVFIWAVAAGRVLQCSLGYYITPLVSVLLAVVVLRERLRRLQAIAVALAAAGVAMLVVAYGAVPWVALILAISFGSYGLLRKVIPVDPVCGLFVETAVLLPVAAPLLVYLSAIGTGAFAAGPIATDGLLLLAGPITALPLVLFVAGARRIPLAAVGLLQYITPTFHFLLAVAVFGEPFSVTNLVSFVLIWTALALYTASLVRGSGG